MSLLSVLIPLCAVFLMVALASAAFVSVLLWLRRRFWAPSSARPYFGASLRRSTTLRAAILAAPLLIAALACLAVISVAFVDGCHCAQHDLHHPHLCFAHPVFAHPLLEAATWFLGVWALLLVPRLLRIGWAVIASRRYQRKIRLAAPTLLGAVAVRIVDCADRSAFTIGALTPLIVFDHELWEALTDEQRCAVVLHEAAHLSRRDGFTLVVLRLCAVLFPRATAKRLIDGWSAAVELSCDRHAAAKLGDETAVADALVAVERARARTPISETGKLATVMTVASSGSIEHRVMALLDGPADHEPRSALANDVLALTLIAIAAAVATWMSPGDWVHHGVETLAGLLTRVL